MRRPPIAAILLLAAVILIHGRPAGGEVTAAKPPQKVAGAIAAMLGEKPAGFGRPITDRAAWKKLARLKSYREVIPDAEALLKEPIPDQPDDLFLDFSRTGNRTRWQSVAARRRKRIGGFTLAECLENKGRFLPALEKIIAVLCEERTWVYPAHDRSLANFKGTTVGIDLSSSRVAWNMATADYLLGDKLSDKTRKLIRENVHRRIFEPYLAMVAGKRRRNWWMTGTNNWNAVCLAGVTGSALALIESREQRAVFIEAGRKYSQYFLKGFTPDGYCSEGVGYWGYGFGHYVMLAEMVHQATGGRVDMMEPKEVRMPATYPVRIEIINGVYPAFADCGVGSHPRREVMHFLSRRYQWGADPARDVDMAEPSSALPTAMMYSFPNSATKAPPAKKAAPPLGIRTWFDTGGVLICRPAPGSKGRMGVALKGGHNAEHHNHSDVGSYVVVVGRRPVLVDPGAEVYTSRTFSGRRYDSKVLNSLGHPVPRVAGRLQVNGRGARGKVLKTEFTDKTDTLVLDIRSAYKVAELKKLERTFVYSREGAGSLTVTDEVAFSSAKEFETALITLGRWKKLGPKSVVVRDGNDAVRVDIEAEGADFEIRAEEIKEDVRTPSLPTRLGIKLTKPVTKATITMTITPAG